MDDRKRGISSASASTSPAKKLKKAKHKADGELTNDDVDMDLLTGVHKLSELPKRGIKLFGLDTSEEENERLHKARGIFFLFTSLPCFLLPFSSPSPSPSPSSSSPLPFLIRL